MDWSLNTLATWCKETTHWKRPWCWERLKAGREGDNRGWDGWMASPTRWTTACNSMFSFLENCQTIFHCGSIIFSSTSTDWEFWFFTSSPMLVPSSLFYLWPFCIILRCYLIMVFICISWCLKTVNIFWCIGWHFVCLLRSNVYSDAWSVLQLACFLLLISKEFAFIYAGY